MQYLKNKFDSLNGAPFICFGDFNVRSSNEFDIFSPTYQFANGHNGTYFDTYNLADWSTRRLDNIICSNDFIIAAKGVVPTSLSDHSIFFTILNVPNELQAKKNVFDTKYNDLISAINTALADGTATEAEKLDVDAKIELFKTAISDLGVTYDLSVQEVYNADYVQNTGSINEIIESGIRGDMRLDAPLPTFITMDNNGITATTEDTERYARMDYRGFFVKKGAFSLERPDGYLLINDGLANFDFSIDSSEPPFMDGGVTQSGLFFRGTNFNWGSCNYYSYKQTGRYLKLMLSVKCDAGTTGWVRILNGNTELWKYTTTQTSFFGEQVTATIDLGAPTGLANDFYLQLATGDSTQTKAAYVRVLRKWLEG
jgi:hypothetical protein